LQCIRNLTTNRNGAGSSICRKRFSLRTCMQIVSGHTRVHTAKLDCPVSPRSEQSSMALPSLPSVKSVTPSARGSRAGTRNGESKVRTENAKLKGSQISRLSRGLLFAVVVPTHWSFMVTSCFEQYDSGVLPCRTAVAHKKYLHGMKIWKRKSERRRTIAQATASIKTSLT
jgi:hypothetical protein